MTIKDYILGEMKLSYLTDDNGVTELIVMPSECACEEVCAWEKQNFPFSTRARYVSSWYMGNLAYFHLSECNMEVAGLSMKSDEAAKMMHFDSQDIRKNGKETKIITKLKSNEGYHIIHTVTYTEGFVAFECETEFINESGKTVTLEMLSSFALDNLSPFQSDDAPNKYKLHRFLGGWSMEGRELCQSLEELSLEKSWSGYSTAVEKWGSLGSYPVERYFPTAAFEDSDKGVMWGVQLSHNASWQMELTRKGDFISFSGGIGDNNFCDWKKALKNGESFKSPKAYITAVKGDIYDVCHNLTQMQRSACESQGEKGLPIVFNEYCTSWGSPTQKKVLSYLKTLKELGVKYLVIDAGWCKEGGEQKYNGDWIFDKTIFPDVKEMNRVIRESGLIPGLWFELEVSTIGSQAFESEYDHMHLKRNGYVIKNGNMRSFWDLRRDDVKKYLDERVIGLLKECDFGYIKVDYNANIGKGVDGDETPAENLRQHLQEVNNFFRKMKKEIPDLIIENCAAGGHRVEPGMNGLSALCSGTDAHECVEIPYVAVNLHNHMLPQQSLVWSVVHTDDSKQRLIYTLSAACLGRMLLSGDIDKLESWQTELVKEGINFYGKLENVIKYGKTKVYGNRGKSMRYPEGTQIVLRSTEDEILVVVHGYENAKGVFEVMIPENFVKAEEFYADFITVNNGKIIVEMEKDFTAGVLLLKKE